MYATNYFETAFLNTMKNITFAAPSQIFVGLYITNPTDEGAGVEISYTGYERQQITFSNAAEEEGQIQIKNLEQIRFPETATDAGTVTHIGISDSKIGGNMLAYGRLIEDLDVRAGEAPILLAGEVIMYSTGQLSKSYKKKMLNVLRGESITGIIPHVALFNGDPDNGGSELLGENYARVEVEFTVPTQNTSGQSVISNNAEIKFNRPSTGWGMWNHTAIMDNLTQGEPIWIHNRGLTKELKKGYMPLAEVGALKFALN